MTNTPEAERERKKRERDSTPQPKSASEQGKSRGAGKQLKSEPRGGHPKQKTTHPVEND
jgi:hypothetical protein